jgi:cell wall-associated NlpC family hydrolase
MRAASAEGSHPLPDRIRFALLFLVVLACAFARVGGALGATHAGKHAVRRTKHATRHAARVTKHAAHAKRRAARARSTHATHATKRHLSHATAVAREQAKIVSYARRFIGVRYVYGGTSPRTGFDCSGFTRFVYAHFGISLPHYSVAQFDLGRRVARVGLRPGDLVFFDGLGHVGLYVGGGRFIHAPHTGTDVQISPLAEYGYVGARRVV